MNAGDIDRIDIQDIVNYVVMGAFAPIMRRDKISIFHQRTADIAPIINGLVISLVAKQQAGMEAPQVFDVKRLPRRATANVGTSTEDILVKMERCLRKDGVFTFGFEVEHIRPIIHGLVAELFAEQVSLLANQDSMVA